MKLGTRRRKYWVCSVWCKSIKATLDTILITSLHQCVRSTVYSVNSESCGEKTPQATRVGFKPGVVRFGGTNFKDVLVSFLWKSLKCTGLSVRLGVIDTSCNITSIVLQLLNIATIWKLNFLTIKGSIPENQMLFKKKASKPSFKNRLFLFVILLEKQTQIVGILLAGMNVKCYSWKIVHAAAWLTLLHLVPFSSELNNHFKTIKLCGFCKVAQLCT